MQSGVDRAPAVNTIIPDRRGTSVVTLHAKLGSHTATMLGPMSFYGVPLGTFTRGGRPRR